MASADVLEPGELLEVLANIDLGTKRWRRKAKILSVIGRWGDVHEIGRRELGERTGISAHLLTELVVELIEARIISPVFVGQGSRASAWVVNPRIDQWTGVPWEQPVAAVRLWTFHVEHEDYAVPGRRRASGTPSRRRASRRSEGDPDTRHGAERRREGDPDTRHGEKTAARIRDALARQSQPDPQSQFPSHVGSSTSATATGGAEGRSTPDSGEWRALRGAVLAAAAPGRGGAKFLNGPPLEELVELYREVGAEQLLEWLPEAPTTLQVPGLVSWLADQRCRPSDELLARLDERARRAELEAIAAGEFGGTTAGMPGGELLEQPGPSYREFRGHEDQAERADAEVARDLARQARQALKGSTIPSPDDRMTTTSGGSPT